ncbi:unnamed protein product [Schistosoma mattheei]|uniref:Uncharacterized protein n=1 Tax=Schistosoma mattheei TaxID=31246 RepID=A0A3P8KRT6_9TREM|nr:unnamed protein product [Schistosoma mattheei]
MSIVTHLFKFLPKKQLHLTSWTLTLLKMECLGHNPSCQALLQNWGRQRLKSPLKYSKKCLVLFRNKVNLLFVSSSLLD